MATKSDYAFYRSLKICVECKKEPSYGSRALCILCSIKKQDRQRQYYEKNKEILRTRENEQKRIQYSERQKAGLCAKCGKVKATPGYKTCSRCRYKNTTSAGILRYTGKRR